MGDEVTARDEEHLQVKTKFFTVYIYIELWNI